MGEEVGPPPKHNDDKAWPRTPSDAVRYAKLAAPSLVGSALFPLLADAVQPPARPALPLVFLFLVARRAVLYSWATSAVELAALRSYDASPSLGQRLERVTREGLAPLGFEFSGVEVEAIKTLDATTPAQQAAALPLLLGGTLLTTFVLTTPTSSLPGLEDVAAQQQALEQAKLGVAAFGAFSRTVTCLFFVNAEARAVARALASDSDGKTPAWLELLPSLLAAAAVSGAVLLPSAAGWPLQNCVNVAVAIGVARVLQLPQLGAVATALLGATAYDVLFTGDGASAATAVDAVSVPNGASIMESVARARLLGEEGWQPGLLAVYTQGRLSDALGLGDVVFPAILAGWARRFDGACGGNGSIVEEGGEEGGQGKRGDALRASMTGYVLGCVFLELFGGTASAALPFLGPSMLTALGLSLAKEGRLGEALALSGEAEGASEKD